MELKEIIIMYPIALALFLVIDFIWLAFIAKDIYFKELKSIVLTKDGKNISARLKPAFVFYLLFIVGILFFVLNQAVEENSILIAIQNGSMFGLLTYGTYDLTNYSVLKDWSLKITVIDIVWGVVLSSIISLASFGVFQLLF